MGNIFPVREGTAIVLLPSDESLARLPEGPVELHTTTSFLGHKSLYSQRSISEWVDTLGSAHLPCVEAKITSTAFFNYRSQDYTAAFVYLWNTNYEGFRVWDRLQAYGAAVTSEEFKRDFYPAIPHLTVGYKPEGVDAVNWAYHCLNSALPSHFGPVTFDKIGVFHGEDRYIIPLEA